ncbi:Fic family protein [Arthrobacter sp. SDTb3-6]|uniref:Fic family protein n=1 Tax=Arthrobacter sp. SDTb3-6 TaxID=2713571 RepID=UPI00159D4C11|nr:Fic family protein [Arthrobacter sp. SDTb3-6]NVN00727.1 Fic family protein [Arthrobacter sp. SDTb3-6]
MQKIEFPEFSFSSPLAGSIIVLERLRGDLSTGTTHPAVFMQLKSLFQLMSSIMSARIEGNRTSIVDAIEGAVASAGNDVTLAEGVQEIINLQEAAAFVDTVVQPGTPITHALVRELHKIAVDGLKREGDKTPGSYRTDEVTIGGSDHVPPLAVSVQGDMSELLDFVNSPVEQSFDLLKVAIAHHRFVWIHPFGNGNGRVCRLFTYATLVSQGLSDSGMYRAVNPTAVFGSDRARYYSMLEQADTLEPNDIVQWCAYLLNGILEDMQKLNKLSDSTFVLDSLLRPSIKRGVDAGALSRQDAAVLDVVGRLTEVKASDLEAALPGSVSSRSQQIRKLVDRKLIQPIAEGKRSYQLVMAPGPLTPFIIRQLDELGFLPNILKDDFA